MSVLLVVLVWFLAAPVVALLVSVVCRGGLVEDGYAPVDEPQLSRR